MGKSHRQFYKIFSLNYGMDGDVYRAGGQKRRKSGCLSSLRSQESISGGQGALVWSSLDLGVSYMSSGGIP